VAIERSAGPRRALAEDLKEIARQKGAVSVTVYASGPYLVRGPLTIEDDHGKVLAVSRGTVALCRCGRSRQKPFCDGSHKALRRWGPPAVPGAQTASCSAGVDRSEEPPAPQAPRT
jgi:CDGSH-type Zn-finger protein